jgi:23S rRNA-/tRNA-specific pseudouridylate synthase
MILQSTPEFVAVNKPAGISVHDAPGPGTSLLRLLREQHKLEGLTPVHRLDKDASGVLLLAKSKDVARDLTNAWPGAEKTYIALAAGIPKIASGTIDAPILEHQTGKPERMANAVKYFQKQHPNETLPPLPPPKTSAVHPAGRTSQTDYRVLQHFKTSGGLFSLLEVHPRQGRMHQIRVHLAQLGCPLLFDKLYGFELKLPEGFPLTRMPLHAAKLSVDFRGKRLTFEAPLAEDIEGAIKTLRS